MQENKPKRFSWFAAIMLLLSGSLLCVHIYAYIRSLIEELFLRGYLHTALYDFKLLIDTVLFSVVIPLGLFLGCVFALKAKKRGVKIGLSIACVIVLLIHFIPAFFFNAIGSGIASYTEDMDDYGVFEQSVDSAMERYQLQDFFPDKELLQENAQYFYCYTYGVINEDYYIQLDAQFKSPDTYDCQKGKLMDMGMDTLEISGDTYYSLTYGTSGCVVTYFDEENQQISYYMFKTYGSSVEEILNAYKR